MLTIGIGESFFKDVRRPNWRYSRSLVYVLLRRKGVFLEIHNLHSDSNKPSIVSFSYAFGIGGVVLTF